MSDRGRGDATGGTRGGTTPAPDPGDAVPPGVGAPDDDRGSAAGGHDPGDAVPPGVAPADPPPEPTEEDRRVLEKLRDLPRRG